MMSTHESIDPTLSAAREGRYGMCFACQHVRPSLGTAVVLNALSDFVLSVFRECLTPGPFPRRESARVHEGEHDFVERRQRVTSKCVKMRRGGSSPPRRLEVRCSIQLSYRRVP